MAIVNYHPFTAFPQLEYEVLQLADSGAIAEGDKNEFSRWHNTVHFKLRSANYYFEELTKQIEFISNGMAQGVAPDTFHLNRALDAFLFCLSSGQDVLGRELDFLYGHPMAGEDMWYLTGLCKKLSNSANTRPTTTSVARVLDAALDRAVKPSRPLIEIRDYRSVATHQLLIPTSEVTMSSGGVGTSTTAKLYLPDNASSLSCTRIREIGPTCKNWFCAELGVFDRIYQCVRHELLTHRTIPLP